MIPQGCFTYSSPDQNHTSEHPPTSRSRGLTDPASPVSKLNPFKSLRHGTTSRLSNNGDSPALTAASKRSSAVYSECDPFLQSRPSTGLGISSEPDKAVPDTHFVRRHKHFFTTIPRKRNNSPDTQTQSPSNRLRQLLRKQSVTEIIDYTPTKDHAPTLNLPLGLDDTFADPSYLSSPESTNLSSPACPTFSSSDSSRAVSRISMDSSTVGRSPALPHINGIAGSTEAYDDGAQTTPQPAPLPSGPSVQNHDRVASPATARPATSGSSTVLSHLSGLVCNVHRTTGKEPHPLVGATTTIIGDVLYVFGGRRLSRTRSGPTSDLYQLDLLRRHWSRVETKGDVPPARYFHSMCALGATKMVCYGGMSPEAVPPQATATSASTAEAVEAAEAQVTVMSDIHIYDIATQTWTRIETQAPPQGRYAHCAAILPSAAIFASESSTHDQGSRNVLTPRDGRGGAEMLIVGGQDSANRYIEQISIFNLRSLTWTSTRPVPGRSCGAYRSVIIPLTTMSAAQVGDATASEQDRLQPDAESIGSGSPMLMYTNYNFLDVKLELQIRNTDGTLSDKAMQGSVSPPGLRFPSGGILNNHFVVSGTFLTSSKQEFALWALDLKTLTWSKIDTANSVFSQGSWNRGVLWARRNAFVILGNRKRNLVEDYNNRRLNFTNMCLVQLETFGLYDNPRTLFPMSDYTSVSSHVAHNLIGADRGAGGRWLGESAINLGKQSQAMRELSDMDFIAVDGTRLPVNSRIVAIRWGPYFAILMHEAMAGTLDDAATLRGADSTFGDMSRNSSVTITPSVNTAYSIATTVTDNHTSEDKATLASNRPRALYLPHTAPTLKTLVYYLYTSSLPPITSPMTTPQILCSLLQLARPYKVDGLLEAVIERLHESLDGRNAAAIFNAAAMGAGGGGGASESLEHAVGAANAHPPRAASLAGLNLTGLDLNGTSSASSSTGRPRAAGVDGLRIIPGLSNGISVNGDDLPPNSAASTASMRSQASQLSQGGSLCEDTEIWDGGWSAVIGLQKRGLRGLMEGRRMRERGKGPETSASAEPSGINIGPSSSGAGSAGGLLQGTENGRIGLGIA